MADLLQQTIFCRIWRRTKSALSDVRERFNVIWPHNPHFSIMSTGPLFYHVRLGRLMFYTDFDPSLPLDFQPGGIVARSLLDVTLPSLCLAFHGLLGQPVALDPEVASTLAEVGGWGWKYHWVIGHGTCLEGSPILRHSYISLAVMIWCWMVLLPTHREYKDSQVSS